MDNEVLELEIVARLGKAANLNDLTLEICDKYGFSWSEAVALIRRVEATRGHAIARRQFPPLFFIALFISISGVVLIIYDSSIIISLLKTDLHLGSTSPEILAGLKLLLDIAIAPLTGILVGIGMILGSLVGMRQAWSPIIEHLLEKKDKNPK